MSNYYCQLCDKSIKFSSKKKLLNSKYHKSLSDRFICKYTVKNPNFLHIEDIIKNFVNDYNKKFEFYINFCKWKLHFLDTIIEVKSDRLYNSLRKHFSWKLKSYLISKIEDFESDNHKFSHISEMNILFIIDFKNMTYEHYLKLPKSILEWTIIRKLSENPKLIKAFDIKTKHPLVRKYRHIINNIENRDLE